MDVIREGYAARATPADDAAIHRLTISRATALADLLAEYAFFTHGLLSFAKGWAADPVEAAALKLRDSRAVVSLDLPHPVFQEIGPIGGWNNRLMLCRREEWPTLFREIAISSLVDRDRGWYYRLLVQNIPVPDALALARMATDPAVIPTVPVAVFGLDGNRRCVALAPPPAGRMGLFRPAVYPPEAATVALAAAILGESDRPFQVPSTGEVPT